VSRVPVSHWTVTQWEATRALLAGRLADAERLAERGAEAARDAGFSASIVQHTSLGLLWCIRLAHGRLSELRPIVEKVRGAPDRPAWSRASEAQMACELGDEHAAREAFAAATANGLFDSPHGLAWATTMISAADVVASLDERSWAARLYELLEPCAGTMAAQSGPVDRAVGRLAATLGRADEAKARVRAAVALCERMDARAFLAIARHDLALLLLPGEEGRRLLEQAHAAAEALGMPGWERRARSALDRAAMA
jgi:hypothetical protein